MQPLSLQETLGKVLSLNSEQNPYQYAVSGNDIVGNWKIADVKWVALMGARTIDKQYSITITLDEATRTYAFNEQKTASGSKFSFDPMTGSLSFGKTSSSFSGKMTGKEFEVGAGTSVVQGGQQGNIYKYSFDTRKIKEPLFSMLKQCGWQQKKGGLLARLSRH
jgi:hypothetical protein